MKELKLKDFAEMSIVAAIYVVLTLALTPLSYGDVQFRLSEALMLLVLYKRRYAISMIVGCLVANLFSPVGWVDILFGTLATAVACLPMLFIKNMEISSLFPSVSNGLIVGLELAIVYDLPIAFTMLTVFLGEFVVVSLIGIPLFRSFEKNEGFMKAIDAEPLPSRFKINPYVSLNLAIFFISIVCYVKLSLNEVTIDDNTTYYTLFYNLRHGDYIISISLLIIGVLSLIVSIFFNNLLGLIFDIILDLAFIIMFILVNVLYKESIQSTFYLYLLVPGFMIGLTALRYLWYKKSTEILNYEDKTIDELN